MRRSLLACFVLTALLAAAAPSLLHAQDLLPMLRGDTLTERSFVDMQRGFLAWSKAHDLEKTKGWKWYARWEWFNRTRSYGDGSIPDEETVWREASAVSARKRSARMQSRSGGWSPVGPTHISDTNEVELSPGIGRINCVTFHPTDSNTFWVGVAQGGVWKTVNGGESWRPLTDDLPILRISDIAVDPVHPDTLYISVCDYEYIGVDLIHAGRKRNTHYGMGIFKSTDGGESWSQTGLGFKQTDADASLIRRLFIDRTDTRRLVAAGVGGVWISEDGGTTWAHTNSDLVIDIERDPRTPATLYASTGFIWYQQSGAAGIMKSTDFGKTWSTLATPIPSHEVQRVELAISPSNPLCVYALACGLDQGFHGLYRSTDGGTNWETRSKKEDGVNILGSSDGSGGGGQGVYDLALLVDPVDPERIITGGVNLWGSRDGGRTWDGVSYWLEEHGPTVHADQHFLAYNKLSGRYFVCNDGGIYATDSIAIGSWSAAHDSSGYRWPTVWTNLMHGMEVTSFYRIGLSRNNPGTIVAGAQDNASWYHRTGSWINIFGGDGMDCLVHPDDPRTIYGSSQYGFLMKSTDGGIGETIEYNLTRVIREQEGEAGEWTTPIAMHPKNPEVIYAAYGNLWRSIDGGSNWTRISSFPPMPGGDYPTPACALSIVGEHPENIYLAKRVYHQFDQPTTLWRTSNDGATWENITAGLPDSLYLTSIATSASDPDVAWVTFGGFNAGQRVYRTDNGGANWVNISRDLPNIPVNSVVYQNGTGANQIYVGTDNGVYYTNDRMSGWEIFSENLPSVIVSELEIDSVGRKLYAATFGRGVWVSDLAPSPAHAPTAGREATSTTITADGERILLGIHAAASTREGVIEIVDITGRVLHSESIRFVNGTHTGEIPLRLPYGVYFARLIIDGATDVTKFAVD
jgi:photosystem II stability/assembly factor-like uncharacterized protein